MKTYPLLVLALTACGQVPESNEEILVDSQKTTAKVTTQSDPKPELSNSVSLTLSSSLDLPECTQDRSGQLVWLLKEKEFRSCVPEENKWVIVSIVGERGERGESGATGTSCSVEPSENGANIVCGQDIVFIANGAAGVSLPGINGRDGTLCNAVRGDGGVNIVCGEQSAFVADGESIQGPAGNDGRPGTSCAAARAIGGVNITCGNQDPVFIADGQSVQGAPGRDGTSCSATRAIGGANITCENQEPIFVADGQSIQGIAGSNGQNARQVMVRTFPSPSAGACPGNADFMWIAFYFDDNNNGYFDETVDEEFRSEPICQGGAGPAGIQGVAGPAGSDAAATKQLILHRNGVRVGPVVGENAGGSGNSDTAIIVYVEAINRFMEFSYEGVNATTQIWFRNSITTDTYGYLSNVVYDARVNAIPVSINGVCTIFDNPASSDVMVTDMRYLSTGTYYATPVTIMEARKFWRNTALNNPIYCTNAVPTFTYE